MGGQPGTTTVCPGLSRHATPFRGQKRTATNAPREARGDASVSGERQLGELLLRSRDDTLLLRAARRGDDEDEGKGERVGTHPVSMQNARATRQA